MKLKVISTCFLIALLISSCGKKEENQTKKKDLFTVTIEGIFAKNDKLQVFYLVEGGEWKDENSVFRSVYASSEMQKIVINFPEKVFPENIRVDLGYNTTQQNVTIKNISIQHNSKVINGDFDAYKKYFYTNEFVTWDPNYYGYKLSVINNQYDPFLMGSNELKDELQRLKY
ncbi:hypothetical protein [Flavobacterium chungbukense]|uniref:Lipoprotein n=1 Tax=Flavobacterium chungbukense TaxID=877464 RepID=A0ABP7XZT1_9FLAO|nr:hypothetical protein [Flavobacterium chungbukense]MCC4922032.1 hypothetical protein [Flavobacterium chungbukense]